jgi:osmotically-inducible protein OsmY
MAFRRAPDRPSETVDPYRPRYRGPEDTSTDEEFHRYRPRGGQRGLGYARERDVQDGSSQSAAPRSGGRYDRTGEDGYERGLEQFERQRAHHDAAREYSPAAPWELDEGGVQFGRPSTRAQRDVGGPHGGRGPRGYQRSDERIREDVCDALTEADDVDASGIDVQVASGVVTLTGTVDSRYAKRRSEDLAESVSGVSEVQNHLRLQAAETNER